MKEAIGGTWLFGIVITFIVFFTTFLSFSTNYSKTFKVKDEILSIIERYKGVNTGAVASINDRIEDLGYYSSGSCSDNSGEKNSSMKNYSKWLGFQRTGGNPVVNSNNSSYCIRRYVISAANAGPIGHPTAAYYQVVTFFKLDWPIIGSLINIRVEGESSVIHAHNDEWNFE